MSAKGQKRTSTDAASFKAIRLIDDLIGNRQKIWWGGKTAPGSL